MELAELGHFLPHFGELLRREPSRAPAGVVPSLVLLPLVGQFVQFFPIVGQLFRRRVHRFARCAAAVSSLLRQAIQRAGNGVGGRGEQLAQDQRHQWRWLAGRA